MPQPILEVLNVGQGDCLILRPNKCDFNGYFLLIDTGTGCYDFTNHLSGSNPINVFITHHDNDHLGGFKYLLKKDVFERIDTIYLPYYQNEITLIAKSILNIKGISNSVDCNEFIDNLEQLVNNQLLLVSLNKGDNKFRFLCDKTHLCNHLDCLNPPTPHELDAIDWMNELSYESFTAISKEIFQYEFANAVNSHYISKQNGISGSEYRIIDDLLIINQNEYNKDNDSILTERAKTNFYISFIMKNISDIRSFNNNPTRENMRVLYDSFVKYTHDACLVLKAEYEGKIFLLTGDASKKVFYRLIDKNADISADYLKVPHHGSKHNLDEKILNSIKPHYAIISHKNRKFGNSKDSHPNMEVLELLSKHNVEILLTNNVIKEDITVMEKSKHSRNDKYICVE